MHRCMFIVCGHYHQKAGEICTVYIYRGPWVCGHYHQEAGEICTVYNPGPPINIHGAYLTSLLVVVTTHPGPPRG